MLGPSSSATLSDARRRTACPQRARPAGSRAPWPRTAPASPRPTPSGGTVPRYQVFYVGRRDGLTSSCRLAAAAALSLRTVSISNSASVVPTSHKWLACIRWRCTHERTKDKAHTQDVCMWGWQRERENEERRLGEMLSSVMLSVGQNLRSPHTAPTKARKLTLERP